MFQKKEDDHFFFKCWCSVYYNKVRELTIRLGKIELTGDLTSVFCLGLLSSRKSDFEEVVR